MIRGVPPQILELLIPVALGDIDVTMQRIATRIQAKIPGAHGHPSTLQHEGKINKLVVRVGDTQVKIEITPVLRGCVRTFRCVTPCSARSGEIA